MPWTIADKKQRMKEDAAMIADPCRWPAPSLCLKTQPWQPENQAGSMLFATMDHNKPLVVFPDDGDPITYATLDELVERWSVD